MRAFRVAAALVVTLSMTTGAFVLVSLGDDPAPAGDQVPRPVKRVADLKLLHDTFTFVRARYSSGGAGRGGAWQTDYPDSDINLTARVAEELELKTDPKGKILDLTDPDLGRYPFVYLVEPGRMALSADEVKGLRKYLLNGGFLVVDDFWGPDQWANFRDQFQRVFPDRPLKEIPLTHPIFHCFYDLKEKPQVPSIHSFVATGKRDEGVGEPARYWGVSDDRGRLMAVICHNTDLGDGWERVSEEPRYFREISQPLAYPMGLNLVVYALTGGIVKSPEEIAADEAKAVAEAARLREVIETIRKEEEKYRRLETSVRILTKAPERGEGQGLALVASERRHTVVRDDLFFCRVDPISNPSALPTPVRGSISAYDGEKTRSVDLGLCANVHVGRCDSPHIVPPHAWALMRAGFDFPLSVVLDGTAQVQRDVKVQRYVDRRGVAGGLRQIEATLAGEEEVEGLRCVRIKVREWIGGNLPMTYRLWLATDRNYLCVRSQTMVGAAFGAGDESVVNELREIAPGIWLPARITYSQVNGGVREFTLLLDQAALDPQRPREFFSDVAIPSDLPVFTVENGHLAGPSFRTAAAPESSDRRMAEIVESVRANERRYHSLETEIERSYRHFRNIPEALNARLSPWVVATDALEKSATQGETGWHSATTTTTLTTGNTSRQESTEVGDGGRTVLQWIDYDLSGKDARAKGGSRVRKAPEAIFNQRPHTFSDRTPLDSRPLSDRLELKADDRSNPRGWLAQWLGEEMRDGHLCDVVRLASVAKGPMTGGTAGGNAEARFENVLLFWLAKDRNDLPIRQESYSASWSAELPATVATLGDLREIAPGVWYPFRRTLLGFEQTGSVSTDARLVISYRHEDRVRHAALGPTVPPAWFTELSVDGGTKRE